MLALSMSRDNPNYGLCQSEIAGKRVMLRQLLMMEEQIKRDNSSKGVN